MQARNPRVSSQRGLALSVAVPGLLHPMCGRQHGDPDQFRNLIDGPEHREAAGELFGRVLAHNRGLASPALEWLEAAVRDFR